MSAGTIDVLAVEAAYERDDAAVLLSFQQGDISFSEWKCAHDEHVARYYDALADAAGAQP